MAKLTSCCERRRGGVEGAVGGHCPQLWVQWSAEGPSKSVGAGHCAEARTLGCQHQLPKYGIVPCLSFPQETVSQSQLRTRPHESHTQHLRIWY